MEDPRLDDRKRLLKRTNTFFLFVDDFIYSSIPGSHQKERRVQHQSQEKEETRAYSIQKKEGGVLLQLAAS
jgi:hypothetical protein